MPTYSDIAGVTDDFLINGKLTVDGLQLRAVTLTSSSNLTAINADLGDLFVITLSENTTFQNPTGTPSNGQLLQIRIASSTSRAISFGTAYQTASSLVLPTATTGGSAEDYIAFRYNSTDSKWDFVGTTIGQIPTAADNSITPAKLTQPLTRSSPVNTTSGSSVTISSIPSWVKRIQIAFNAVSTNGSTQLGIQIGDSGGLETTGYVCQANSTGSGGTTANNSTAGFLLMGSNSAAFAHSGTVTLLNVSGNIWVFSSVLNQSNTQVAYASGVKTLSDTLTQLALLCGADTFDAGSISILYDG